MRIASAMKKEPTNKNNCGLPKLPNAWVGDARPVNTAPTAANSATTAAGKASVIHQVTHSAISAGSAGALVVDQCHTNKANTGPATKPIFCL